VQLNDYENAVQPILNEKILDILFRQETEIIDGYNMSLASLNLTAAFDVVDRNLLRKRLKIMETPVQLIHLLDD